MDNNLATPGMMPMLDNSWHRLCITTLALIALALASICTINSTRWIDSTFPGFFVMSNRVIASVTLPHWPSANPEIFQHKAVAIDGHPIATPQEFYKRISTSPAGTRFVYTLLKDGKRSYYTAASMKFTSRDYLLIFVPYLVSGLGLALIGITVWYSRPEAPASLALLIGGLSGGLFAVTATDLYSPYWFFRLHVLGEAFFPASLLMHLAMVFPVDRFRRHRRLLLSIPYVVAAVLGLAYEIFLYRPGPYTLIHDLCMDYTGLGGASLLAAVGWDFFTSDSQLARQRIRVLLLGLVGGFAFPGFLMFCSGITGGKVPVNYAGFTVILFPLSIGYAIVQHDLFEIDALLKRSAYYMTISLTLAMGYLGFLAITEWGLHSSAIARSTYFPLLFTLIVIVFVNPLKDAVQQTLDRVFFRLKYNPKKMLESTSAVLASTLQLEDIISFIWETIRSTMGIKSGGIFIRSAPAAYERIFPVANDGPVLDEHLLLAELADMGGRILSRPDLDENPRAGQNREVLRRAFDSVSAEMLIPLALKRDLIGFIAIGKKESGAFFSADDMDFLKALANQSALSIANALAYREIQSLNAALEQRVEQRTAELSRSNHELHSSVQRLEQAYRDLQRSQQDLSRAEKMATLGRLAAGVAHEMNTPLGASMTSLKLLQDLVNEYESSVGDPTVSTTDHREIAFEMSRLVGSTREWLRKAAAHIGSLKLHTRALQNVDVRSFPVLQIVEDVGLLLSHRLRLSQSRLVVECSSENPQLDGDPGKLGQVLTNLLSNAIDANREGGRPNAEIRVVVQEDGDTLVIRVEDQGPGISSEDIVRIFDEFFSTKPFGEGTGLGLSIARDIISNLFNGTITVKSTLGTGSIFTVRIPRAGGSSRAPSVAA
jgi:signal transduction histidine kinase